MRNTNDDMEIEIMEAFTSMKSDQEIGMPDVEQELAKLRAKRKMHNTTALRKVVAAVAVIIAISTVAVAAVVNHQTISNFFTGNKETVVAENTVIPDAQTISSDKEPCVVKFDNSELMDIMSSISSTYNVEVVFKNAELMHIHLHFQYDTSEKLEKVIRSLNMFEKIKVRLNGDKLEVE